MRKDVLAESILAMATSRERAAVMVGDFFEEHDADESWRLWFFVARTTIAQSWRQMAAAPFGAVGIALYAMFVEFGYGMLFSLLFSVALYISRVSFHTELPAWPPLFLSSLLVPCELGRWIFRPYKGRELAGIFTLAILHAVIFLTQGLILWLVSHEGGTNRFNLVPALVWNHKVFVVTISAAYSLTLYPMLMMLGAAAGIASRRQLQADSLH